MTEQPQTNDLIKCLHSGGLLDELMSGENCTISRPCSFFAPVDKGFCFVKEKHLSASSVSFTGLNLILVPSNLASELKNDVLKIARESRTNLIFTANPRLAFLSLVREFFLETHIGGIHEDTTIDPTCEIHETATIYAGVRMGSGVTIGARSVVRENCVILSQSFIGEDCYIGPGTTIGQPGFGYERDAKGHMVHFPHLGSVRIGNTVEIGANTCIDCGTLDDTVIKDGAKIDNLCHIAHNVVIHEDAVVIANSMLGGSADIGPRAWLAPSCTIFNGLSIGADAIVGMHSLVTKNVADKKTVLGVPAIDRDQLKRKTSKSELN